MNVLKLNELIEVLKEMNELMNETQDVSIETIGDSVYFKTEEDDYFAEQLGAVEVDRFNDTVTYKIEL
jgi:hypothetical protein